MGPGTFMNGWNWIIRGWRLFLRQPAQLTTLFALNMFMLLLLSMVPLLGQVLPLILTPACTMTLMSACATIERNEPLQPHIWLATFRSPAFPTLFRLGLLYLVAGMLAYGIVKMVDHGFLVEFFSQSRPSAEPNTADQAKLMATALLTTMTFLPATLIFWYCAPLIMWRSMPLGKALFYSAITVWRNKLAFVGFALAWLTFTLVLPTLVLLFTAMVLRNSGLLMILVMAMMMVMSVVLYCSFYPSYTDAFEQPDLPAPGL